MPVHNRTRYLAEALASVEVQHYDSLEMIVVDDGSTDSTPQVLAGIPFVDHVLRQAHAGPAAARNRGLAVATGDVIAFIDDDDLWPPGRLRRLVEVLAGDTALDGVLGRIEYFAEDGGEIPDVTFEDPEHKTLTNITLGAGIFRRRAFDRIGTFDEELRCCEDADWYLRAREGGLRLRLLPDVVQRYRFHPTNMTRDKAVLAHDTRRMLKKSLDRRRERGPVQQYGTWLDWTSGHLS